MKKAKVQINRCATRHKNRGIALLLMLSFLIVVFTTVVIARLSLNDLAQKRQTATLKALTETRDAIMAWSLTQNSSALPPGALPCPDTDLDGNLDGNSDYTGIICTRELGAVPFVTLNIPEPRDGDGAKIWYGVSNIYAANSQAQIRNSSQLSPLFLNANRIAFILISQNDALGGQNRGNVSFANRAQFLEGENADADFFYSDLRDDAHNDLVLAMPAGIFWSAVEEVVLSQVASLLQTYNNQCGSYPWADTFSDTDDDSDNNVLEGHVPLGIVPIPWGTGCAPTRPAWLTTHWSRMFYYVICPTIPGSPPTLSPCLQLQDANNALLQTASVVIIAPGISLSESTRPPSDPIDQFFEKENSAPIDTTFQKTSHFDHTDTFNDTIKIIE